MTIGFLQPEEEPGKKDPLRRSFFSYWPSAAAAPRSVAAQQAMARNSTLVAQQGMARLLVLVFPLGHQFPLDHYLRKHSEACSFAMLGLVAIE